MRSIREARQVLAVLQEHAAGPEVAVKQIQLACGWTMRKTPPCGPSPKSAKDRAIPPVPVQAALAELRTAGWEDRAARVLARSVAERRPIPSVGTDLLGRIRRKEKPPSRCRLRASRR